MQVIEALAITEAVSPMELEPPLYEIVEPSALNRIFRPESPDDLRVTFDYTDHTVEIQGDGRIAVDGTEYVPTSEDEFDHGDRSTR
ncbi:HalOD1 output domain-containing protein [Halosolutus halophilus]|uniref:HalOD1 output domain-containing protein n=1 Tax=Halosolutus halophilus TaxID=1552990 RepID=UPI0022350E7A|nr:HalOD1 output domain-containing protein [Halosolutus halophilus]